MKKPIILIISCLALFQLPAQSLTDSLKAHFRFEGNLADETVNANDLQLDFGTETYATVSGPDQALSLSGSDRIVSASSFDNSSYTEISVSLWFNSSNPGQSDQLLLQGAFLGFSLQMLASGHILAFCDGSSANSYTSGITLDDGQWHNLVMTSDGNLTSLYIDGMLDGTNPEPLYVGSGASGEVIFLGQTYFSAKPYSGLLNDVRIYSRALTQSDVTLLFNSSLSKPEYETLIRAVDIYPNPYRGGEIYINTREQEDIMKVEVFTMSGVKLGKLRRLSPNTYSPRQMLKPGVYVLRILNGSHSHDLRLVVGK